ncbi:MAG: nucleotide exchange factor GrpE [Bacillota bacterium]|jgi:molecular chaperone GrpE
MRRQGEGGGRENVEDLRRRLAGAEAASRGTEERLRETEERLQETEEKLHETEERLRETEERLQEIQEKMREAEEKVKENWDLFLRARADLENYRRRVDRDLAVMVRRGKADLLRRLLDLSDTLEQAAGWEESAGPVHRQLLKILADEGVTPMEAVGCPFDPALHEAVDVDLEGEAEPNTVTAELQRGFTYEDEVLRPARVRVAAERESS